MISREMAERVFYVDLFSSTAYEDYSKAAATYMEWATGVRIERFRELDEDCEIFSILDYVELFVFTYKGLLNIFEATPIVSKADICVFCQIAEFYERKKRLKADYVFYIAPICFEPSAYDAARDRNIEVFSHPDAAMARLYPSAVKDKNIV
jgi:hypothetical protein